MPDETDSIAALQRVLVVYRRTIEFLEIQRAQFGAFTPPHIWHQFDDTRNEIARVKRDLRALGVSVEDRPGDLDERSGVATERHAGDGSALLLTYQRMLVDQVRYLSLAGMSRWSDLCPRLADLYVERALRRVGPDNATSETATPGPGPTLADLARPRGARILIEGDHGSGKTTCLRRLALACVSHAAEARADASLVASWPDPLPLPLLLSAREIAAALERNNAAPDIERMPTLSAFWNAIAEWLQYSDLEALVPTIQQLLERGGCLLLIDRLDDLPATSNPHGYMAALARFVARYPDNRYVVTCRAFDAGLMASLVSFTRYALAPLDQGAADAMVARWYPVVGGHAGLLVPEALDERIARLQGALHGDARLRELAGNALELALCILAHAEGHALPDAREVVLRRLADVLLHGWDHGRMVGERGLPPFDLDALGAPERRLALLEPVALALHSRPDRGLDQPSTLSYAELASLLRASLADAGTDRGPAGERVVPQLIGWCCRHGLLEQTVPAAYAMPRRHVREYLAARALAAMPDFPTRAYAVRQESHWRESLLLAVRELGSRRAPHVARLLVRLLLHQPERAQDGTHDLLLAAECLVELGDRSQPDRALRAEVRGRLAELIGSATRPVGVRVRAGMLLGRLGDPRFADQLPHMAHIGDGSFILGTAEGYEDEEPVQWIHVPAFAIGVYPVTNLEYARFLGERTAHPHPRYWHDPRFNNPSCPVGGVTWHDANAYCAWLTERLARAGLLESGLIVRLPLEVEWEKAACWDQRREVKLRYPWGDEWSSAQANTADGRGDWMLAPVGCYPGGASPYGLHDCTGNVWEWTGSVYG
ncbi:MAG TPA: SUMF1/EgtB/PvdO family nonheme iron enzyme, partial [Roseiflexaceae bacterium]